MSSFSLINASAGSGKTHRITLEFLKMILPNPAEASRILSITFTNKAAAEMKSRLISALAGLSTNPDKSNLTHDLKVSFPDWTNRDISQRAGDALKFVLHHYSDIAISTIDSFMQRIIRTFSRELRLPTNYEVTVNDDELNEMVISTIIENANLNPNITRVLKEIIRMQMEESRSPLQVMNELLPLVKHLTREASVLIVNEALNAGSDKMIASFDRLIAKVGAIRQQIMKRLDEFDAIRNEYQLADDDFNKSGNSTSFCEYSRRLRISFGTNGLSDGMLRILDEGNLLKKENAEANARMQEVFLDLKQLVPKYHFARMMARRFPVVALLSEIWSFREEYKAENSMLPVSDFNRILREVISKEPVPFIYMRAGSRYKTIMIDEFQDTSLLQWLNLLPLIHESLSKGNNSWVVGDPKQSIYRWRNGKVEIMLHLPGIYDKPDDASDVEECIQNSFKEDSLDVNYRSDQAIVEFNSLFYRFVSRRFEVEAMSGNSSEYANVYRKIEQKKHHDEPGYVECRLYRDKVEQNETWLPDILALIRDCKAMGYNYSDIAVLTRQNDYGVTISSYLMGLKEPVPVVSHETLKFKASGFCRLAMCVYRLIHCPGDDLNAVETWALMRQYEVADFSQHDALSGFSTLDNRQRGKWLQQAVLSGFPGLDPVSFSFLPPVDQLDLIIHSLNISDRGGFFLLFLREQILRLQSVEGFRHEDIWNWWLVKGMSMSVVVPDAGDAVNIMTIHASKGLQFPVVIVPYFNIDEAKKKQKDLFWHNLDEKEWGVPFAVVNYSSDSYDGDIKILHQQEHTRSLMDTINLMYVATTRAKEKLFVFAFLEKEKTSATGSKPKKGKASDSELKMDSARLLRDFIESGQLNFVQEETPLYTASVYGDKNSIRKEEEEDTRGNKIQIKHFSINPNKPLNSLRKQNAYSDSAELRDSSQKGRVLHELLANINEASDVAPVIGSFVSNGWIDQESHREYLGLFGQLVSQFPFAFPGMHRVLNERELVMPGGAIFRPDRLVLDEEGNWTVIDFKTGVEKQEHKKQVRQYADLLSEAGYPVKSTCIIYIDTRSLNAFSVDA